MQEIEDNGGISYYRRPFELNFKLVILDTSSKANYPPGAGGGVSILNCQLRILILGKGCCNWDNQYYFL